MRRPVFLGVFLALVALLLPRAARAERAPTGIDLYTIGPGEYLYARYGHSLLCVHYEVAAEGRCFDYGVPDREEFVHMAWTSLRGKPSFIAVAIDQKVMLDVFTGQGRAVEVQRLPLSTDEMTRLAARMESDVASRWSYAYHPYFSNCTTAVRDRIDDVSGGRLRMGRTLAGKAPFRELSEEGQSGRIGELFVLALVLGAPSDRAPTPWEDLFLPATLRDGVRDRFAAFPERVAERKQPTLPTSRAVGRVMLFGLALLAFLSIRLAARLRRLRTGIAVVAVLLGAIAIFAELAAVLVVWPELSHNWALVILWPTDLALPWLARKSERWLTRYARLRIGVVLLTAFLELAGVIQQPVLALVALVVMPMIALLSAIRDAKERAETAPAGTVAA